MSREVSYSAMGCKPHDDIAHSGHRNIKGIVHFEIKIWYLSAYPKGIQDVGVFFSSVDPILMFLGQTVLVCQSYTVPSTNIGTLDKYEQRRLWK